jgi:triosephosphate isomerase
MKALIVANWKMNPQTFKEAKKLLEVTKKAAEGAKLQVIVAPPAIFLRELHALYSGKFIAYAAQNAHEAPSGSFTGEVSQKEAHDAGAQYVIVGHAERRGMGETNDDVRRKVAAAFGAKLQPILCIGEVERSQSGEHFNFVREQLRAGLCDVPAGKVGKVIIAYEPVWAIGKTEAMSARDMHEMAIFIRKTVVELHGETGHSAVILYGGSIEESNAPDMLRNGDVRGLLVGRASADPERVERLLQSISTKL